MGQIYRTTNPCVTLIAVTLFAVAFVAVVITSSSSYGSNNTLSSLPFSPWTTSAINTTSSSSSSSSSSSVSFSMPSFRSSSPPNPKTALYPSFNNQKKQRAVDKLIKDLNDESMARRGKERDKKQERIEGGLAGARALIKQSATTLNHSSPLEDSDYVPHGDIYINAHVFHRSYLLMERIFKIFVYEEGDPPIFHYGLCKDIYSMEGLFLNFMEINTHFRTNDPDQAHVYFLPFSVVMILEHLFDPIIRDKAVLERIVGDHVHTISSKYPYWNRSLGADHFMLSCHDWGPRATWYVHQLYFTSIRALCNANTSEFFNPRKDASIPEINLQTGDITGLTGGFPLSNRKLLAFFAGHSHDELED